MRIGIALPISTPAFDPAMLTEVSQSAEGLGFHSLWTFDRLFWAVNPRNRYAGQYDPWPNHFKYTSDPLDVLNFLAARTERIKLGTSVIIAPYYNPVLLARRLTTIDILSNGRLKVGLGLGWSEDEFEAVGVSMDRRGARMDEFLQVLDAIWGAGPVSFQGEFYQFPEAVFGLKPVQQPRPPLFIATMYPKELRRAGRRADGWNPVGLGPGQILEKGEIMRRAAVEAGRDPDRLQIVLRTGIDLREGPIEGKRSPLSGDQDQVREDISRLQRAGVTELLTGVGIVNPARGRTLGGYIDRLKRLSQILE